MHTLPVKAFTQAMMVVAQNAAVLLCIGHLLFYSHNFVAKYKALFKNAEPRVLSNSTSAHHCKPCIQCHLTTFVFLRLGAERWLR